MTQTRPSSPAAADLTGLLAAAGAFLIWGAVTPAFFKVLSHVEPVEIVAHRVLWTVVLMIPVVAAVQGLGTALRAVASWRRLGIFVVTTSLVTLNWGFFIWAILNARLVEASLGYYINPLVNVVLGVVFLGERLTRRQGMAVAMASLGVVSMVVSYGSLPWLSLVLAFTFGFYGLVRKKARVDPLAGLLVETALMLPFALLYLIALGGGAFVSGGLDTDALLVMAGPVTAVPLVLFMIGAQRLKYSTIGILQYIGPTGQLLLGVFVYGESFSTGHAVAFGCIWLALVLFSADAWSTHRSNGRTPAQARG